MYSTNQLIFTHYSFGGTVYVLYWALPDKQKLNKHNKNTNKMLDGLGGWSVFVPLLL